MAVRTDLEMGRGKIAVQVAHASVAALEEGRKKQRGWVEAWLAEGQCKVTVRVSSENDLLNLEDQASKLGIPRAIIRDRGLTQLPPDTATCIGMGPAPANLLDKITRSLKLL